MPTEMYKTVKQGENSLQYKILAQGEEGLGHVKCKKSKRGRTAGIITVVMLLVGGVIATAVLVPLVLTDDFITLTGTFQKFSVSTLRRSHSGNHIVVIAKKPHGWDPSHQNVMQQSSVKTTTSSISHVSNKAQEATTVREPNITTTLKPTTVAELHVKRTTAPRQEVTESISKIKSTVGTTSAESHETNGNNEEDSFKSPTPISTLQNQKNPEMGVSLEDIPSTVQTPYWYHTQKWRFGSPESFITRSKEAMANVPVWIFLGIFFAVSLIITMVIIMARSLTQKKKLIQKELTELKEDKTRLLKPSARASDEE